MTLIRRLTIHHAMAGFAMGLFLAVQTLFLQEKGLGLWHIGLLFGTFGAATALMELPLGAVADLYGRIRTYALSRALTLAGVVLAMVLDSFWALLSAMALLGLARALDSGSIEAWQVDQMKNQGLRERIPSAIARFHAASALAIAAGALLGGYLPDILSPVTPLSIRPTEWNLFAQALVTGLHLLVLGALFHEGDRVRPDDKTSGLRRQLHIALTYGLSNRRLRGVFIAAFVLGLALFSMEAYWQPRVTEIAPETRYAVFGWLATGYFLAAALGPMLIGYIHRSCAPDSEYMLAAIFLLLAPLLALLSLQQELTGFVPLYLGFMLLLSMINVPFEILMAEEAPNKFRSTLFSISSLSLQTGGVVMAYGLSFLVRWLGIAGIWLVLACLLLITGLGLFLRAWARTPRQKSTRAPRVPRPE